MIKVALIGIGYWGSKLLNYINENKDFDLKYACNSRIDLDKVWGDKEITAVVVATRNDSHYSIVKSALLAGKNVMVEKPLALTTKECLELKELAQEKNLTLVVEYTYTFSKAIQELLDLVRVGVIGKPLSFDMSTKHLGRFKGGSVYWLLGSHLLAVLDMFVPLNSLKFSKVDLVCYDGNVETGMILFGNSKVSGALMVSLNYPSKETRVLIYGEKGTAIYNPLFSPAIRTVKYERLEWVIGSNLPKDDKWMDFDEGHNLRNAISYFAGVIQGIEESNVDRAVEITRILEELQCQRSA